jgi:hypothetical protein
MERKKAVKDESELQLSWPNSKHPKGDISKDATLNLEEKNLEISSSFEHCWKHGLC